MGRIVGAMATSHAFTFMEPSDWDEFRARNQESFKKRQGRAAPMRPEIENETPASIEQRYLRIREAHHALRAQLQATKPDALIVVGDDQNENLNSKNLPQIAVYTGGDFRLGNRFSQTQAVFKSNEVLAQGIIERGVADGFDLSSLGYFDDDTLLSHAHVQVLNAFLPQAEIPVVLVFLNAIHSPAITPHRCYEFGQMLRRGISARPADERVMICASGGLSHFTAGYPWSSYRGQFDHGSISEEFDRNLVKLIESGDGRELANLTSDDLLTHGDIELRAWISLLGAYHGAPSSFMVYEPFYRAVMGMAVASWPEAL